MRTLLHCSKMELRLWERVRKDGSKNGQGKRERDPKREWSAGHLCRVDGLSGDSTGERKKCLASSVGFCACR